MRQAADGSFAAAVDLAEHLVEAGMPFREAHGLVGELVRQAAGSEGGVALEDLVAAHPALGPEAVALLAPGVAVTRRTTAGGAGPHPVAAQLEQYRARLRRDAGAVRAAASP
jgi:argininosuccinate lyase